jgi:uncharacterized RDD family membrane protein YckC
MQWYYAIDGQRLGPVPHAELERLVDAGTIMGDTLLWRQGMDQWKTLAEVQERDPAMFAKAPPPPPLPPQLERADISSEEETQPDRFNLDEQTMVSEALIYAGFWRRAGAFLIDLILWLFVWQILSNVAGLWAFPEIAQITKEIEAAGGSMAYKPSPEQLVVLIQFSALVMLIGLVWAVVYDLIFLRRFSATPGKLLFGLQVVQANGKPLGAARIVARCLAKGLAGVPTLCIGLLIVAFDDQKRGLHDFFCGTRVIKKR